MILNKDLMVVFFFISFVFFSVIFVVLSCSFLYFVFFSDKFVSTVVENYTKDVVNKDLMMNHFSFTETEIA